MTAERASRLLSKSEVRLMLGGIGRSTLARWMDKGLIPRPLPGTCKWDRDAIKAALDRASGLANATASEEDELIARAKSWGASA